jgi:hypothetical protein
MSYHGQQTCKNDNCQFFDNCFFTNISSWNETVMPQIIALSNNAMGCRKYKLKEVEMDKVIRAKVEDFVKKQLMFTSVDISNAIKKDGVWVRNSDTSTWLHRNFNDVNDSLAADYTVVTIKVLNNTVSALLYLHVTHSADNYTNRDLEAMTPSQFKRLYGYDPTSTPIACKSAKSVSVKTNGKLKITEFKSGRIRVPAALVKAAGMRPGCKVNFKKIAVNTAKISSPLKVHNDGRLSLPRNCIEVDSTSVKKDSLFAFIDNGVIKFELA